MADTFFRIRKYLRSLGETNFVHYRVQYENGQYTISEWNYTNRVRPIQAQLDQITLAEIAEEKKEKVIHYTDIYSFRVDIVTNRTNYNVIRHNTVSLLFAREIRFSSVGYYRITVTGVSQGSVQTKLMNYATNTLHIEKVIAYFSFTSIIRSTRQAQDNFTIVTEFDPNHSDQNSNVTGTILVEFMK